MNITSHGILHRVLGTAILVLVLAVYGQTLGHDFMGFDDYYYVFRNPDVLPGLRWEGVQWAFTSIRNANWHPLTWISHMADAEAYALFPGGHHLTNVFFHAASSLLLFLLLREATGTLWRSFFVAALFALHPLHVESVAWVSERKDVLSGFFWILTFVCYTRYARKGETLPYLAALACFILGLMSKPMVVTLPFALLLFDYWPLGRLDWRQDMRSVPRAGAFPVRSPSRLLIEKIPFFALGLAGCLVTFHAQNSGGAVSGLGHLGIPLRLGNSFLSYVRYLDKTFWPTKLAIFYPHPMVTGPEPAWKYILAAALVAALTAGALIFARRLPYLAMGWLWFLGTLVPVIGLVQVGAQSMADRYTYLPHMGLFMALVWGAAALMNRLGMGKPAKAVLAGLVLAVLAPLTFIQASYWKNTEILFMHTANVTEGNFLAHNAMAQHAARLGDEEGYAYHYGKAISISPGYVAGEHNKIGWYKAMAGDLEGAKTEFVMALEIRPDHAGAKANLGVVYANLDRFDEAIHHLGEAAAMAPEEESISWALKEVKKGKRRWLCQVRKRQGIPWAEDEVDLCARLIAEKEEQDRKEAEAMEKWKADILKMINEKIPAKRDDT